MAESVLTSIKNQAFRRVVEDGNTIQQLITNADLQFSTGSIRKFQKTLEMLSVVLGQLDSDLNVLMELTEP